LNRRGFRLRWLRRDESLGRGVELKEVGSRTTGTSFSVQMDARRRFIK
jgi:hypothetical protein